MFITHVSLRSLYLAASCQDRMQACSCRLEDYPVTGSFFILFFHASLDLFFLSFALSFPSQLALSRL